MDNSFVLDYKSLTTQQKKGVYFIIAAILFKYFDTIIVSKLPISFFYFYIDYYIRDIIGLALIIFGIKQLIGVRENGTLFTNSQKIGISLLVAIVIIPVIIHLLAIYGGQNSTIINLTNFYYNLPTNFISSIVLGFMGIKFLMKKENAENEYITDWTHKKK